MTFGSAGFHRSASAAAFSFAGSILNMPWRTSLWGFLGSAGSKTLHRPLIFDNNLDEILRFLERSDSIARTCR